MNESSRSLLYPGSRAELHDALDTFLSPPLIVEGIDLETIVSGLEAWGQALGTELGHDVGLPFLKAWWRAPQLRGVLRHEFGDGCGLGPLDFREVIDERPWAPVGTVLHWPAANVPIQPFLSVTIGLLAGNRNIVRVPSTLISFVKAVLAVAPAAAEPVLERLLFVAFAHDRNDLACACAARSDAAMIWGGREAISSVRSLPFPHWARLHVFGPRISAAMVLLDEQTLAQPVELQRLCSRVARETWQFDQQACSSPLALYLSGERRRSGRLVAEERRLNGPLSRLWRGLSKRKIGLIPATSSMRVLALTLRWRALTGYWMIRKVTPYFRPARPGPFSMVVRWIAFRRLSTERHCMLFPRTTSSLRHRGSIARPKPWVSGFTTRYLKPRLRAKRWHAASTELYA